MADYIIAHRHPWQVSQLFMRRAAQASMLLITCDIDSRSVRSWYDRPIVYVAASPVEFMLPPTAFHGFVHFRPRTIVPRTARVVRTSKRWNASNGTLPYGEANLWTKFHRGWKYFWLTLSDGLTSCGALGGLNLRAPEFTEMNILLSSHHSTSNNKAK